MKDREDPAVQDLRKLQWLRIDLEQLVADPLSQGDADDADGVGRASALEKSLQVLPASGRVGIDARDGVSGQQFHQAQVLLPPGAHKDVQAHATAFHGLDQ